MLYIPSTITVGFQERGDTFTGKLAYVIYTDHKGVLRKQRSWDGWRDQEIPTVTIDNTPTPNFTFNKGVQRDGHWGTGRSVVRVWDPRDFEFEISIDNLIGILMHSDVSRRDIVEQCVYAWKGTELVLLPVNSVEYQNAVAHTSKQGNKVSARDLVTGHTYSVKSGDDALVYLGYYDVYKLADVRFTNAFNKQLQVSHKKRHVFYDLTRSKVAEPETNHVAKLAGVISSEVHADYAAMVDKFFDMACSQPIVKLEMVPGPALFVDGTTYFYQRRELIIPASDGSFVDMAIDTAYRYNGQLCTVKRVINVANSNNTPTIVITPPSAAHVAFAQEIGKEFWRVSDAIMPASGADRYSLTLQNKERVNAGLKAVQDKFNPVIMQYELQNGKRGKVSL